ncbi:transcription regulator with HTH domain [Magnetospirillum fulvum MGU-K5]|uniref:Transcription regulator with HTH domain n=2 Tax=Magnetospirillum fulvum TaxID=1082 RepID=S9SBI5_MAGFU|nr:transcription regulator with HTH domain [Magnetospirillum fulvum MGU-K5]
MSVDLVGGTQVIFDIGGNKFRLIFHVLYTFKRLLVKFIGTHAEYGGDVMMDIRPLRCEVDYEKALSEIERFFENEPEPGTSEADEFDLLALMISDYEATNWPIDPSRSGGRH